MKSGACKQPVLFTLVLGGFSAYHALFAEIQISSTGKAIWLMDRLQMDGLQDQRSVPERSADSMSRPFSVQSVFRGSAAMTRNLNSWYCDLAACSSPR